MFCLLPEKRVAKFFSQEKFQSSRTAKNLFPQTTKNRQSAKFSWSRTVDFSRLCILFFTLNQRNVLNRTEDIFFFSTFRDATQDSAQEFHNGFRPALTIKKKKNFSLQKNQINAISASPKFSRKILSMKREYFTI